MDRPSVKFALHPTRCGVLNHCFKLFNRVGFSDDAREIGDFGGISSVFDPYGHWIPHDDYLYEVIYIVYVTQSSDGG